MGVSNGAAEADWGAFGGRVGNSKMENGNWEEGLTIWFAACGDQDRVPCIWIKAAGIGENVAVQGGDVHRTPARGGWRPQILRFVTTVVEHWDRRRSHVQPYSRQTFQSHVQGRLL